MRSSFLFLTVLFQWTLTVHVVSSVIFVAGKAIPPQLQSSTSVSSLAAARRTIPTSKSSLSSLSSSSSSSEVKESHQQQQDRPQLVLDALKQNKSLYYFGLGSNMLRSKVENRSSNGTIQILRMEPAVVKGHRLTFNMKGFPPLEPGMGSLEPTTTVQTSSDPCHNRGDDNDTSQASSSTTAFGLRYSRDECHGALIQLTAENYEKVMRSEGVGGDTSKKSRRQQEQGYEEVVVTAIPYHNATPVQAIALRARPKSQIKARTSFWFGNRADVCVCPSLRYMTILRQGAEELGLKPCYQEFLQQHPVQIVPSWVRVVAKYNLILVSALSFKLKIRWISAIQRKVLFFIYVPSSNPMEWKKMSSHVCTMLFMLPGAMMGFFLVHGIKLVTGKTPPFVTRMITFLDPPSNTTNATTTTTTTMTASNSTTTTTSTITT